MEAPADLDFGQKNSRDYEAYYLPFATKLRGNFVRREHYCPQVCFDRRGRRARNVVSSQTM